MDRKEDVRLSERTARMLRQLKNDDELGHAKRTTLGICLCVLSVLPLFVSLFLDPDNGRNMAVSVGVLLFVVAIGAGILIYDGTMQEAVDMLLQEGEYTKKEKRFNRRYGYVPGVYWCLVTAIYLAWSFSTERWDETWLVFAVGGVLYAAVIGVLKAKKRNKKRRKNVESSVALFSGFRPCWPECRFHFPQSPRSRFPARWQSFSNPWTACRLACSRLGSS